jgi:hypothetical protein
VTAKSFVNEEQRVGDGLGKGNGSGFARVKDRHLMRGDGCRANFHPGRRGGRPTRHGRWSMSVAQLTEDDAWNDDAAVQGREEIDLAYEDQIAGKGCGGLMAGK